MWLEWKMRRAQMRSEVTGACHGRSQRPTQKGWPSAGNNTLLNPQSRLSVIYASWFVLHAVDSPGYVICGAQCKVKMWGTLFRCQDGNNRVLNQGQGPSSCRTLNNCTGHMPWLWKYMREVADSTHFFSKVKRSVGCCVVLWKVCSWSLDLKSLVKSWILCFLLAPVLQRNRTRRRIYILGIGSCNYRG